MTRVPNFNPKPPGVSKPPPPPAPPLPAAFRHPAFRRAIRDRLDDAINRVARLTATVQDGGGTESIEAHVLDLDDELRALRQYVNEYRE